MNGHRENLRRRAFAALEGRQDCIMTFDNGADAHLVCAFMNGERDLPSREVIGALAGVLPSECIDYLRELAHLDQEDLH